MNRKILLTLLITAVTALCNVEAFAQADAVQREASQERSAEEAARLQAVREQLSAQEREVAVTRAQVVEREQELERARRDLERARAEMEAAARQITVLSAGPRGDRSFVSLVPFGRFAGQGRIGASIQNAADGALILAVTPGGAADEAGIMSGDVIKSINGVESLQLGREPTDVVIATLDDLDPGTIVPIEVTRAGESMSFDVEIQEPALTRVMRNYRLSEEFPGEIGAIAREGVPFVRDLQQNYSRQLFLPGLFASRWRDMELVELTEDLGRYFGTDTGLLVVRAPGDEEIGLRDGDVILEIGGRAPNSPEHAMRILTSFVPGETVEFSIMRNDRRQTVDYTIPGDDTD